MIRFGPVLNSSSRGGIGVKFQRILVIKGLISYLRGRGGGSENLSPEIQFCKSQMIRNGRLETRKDGLKA